MLSPKKKGLIVAPSDLEALVAASVTATNHSSTTFLVNPSQNPAVFITQSCKGVDNFSLTRFERFVASGIKNSKYDEQVIIGYELGLDQLEPLIEVPNIVIIKKSNKISIDKRIGTARVIVGPDLVHEAYKRLFDSSNENAKKILGWWNEYLSDTKLGNNSGLVRALKNFSDESDKRLISQTLTYFTQGVLPSELDYLLNPREQKNTPVELSEIKYHQEIPYVICKGKYKAALEELRQIYNNYILSSSTPFVGIIEHNKRYLYIAVFDEEDDNLITRVQDLSDCLGGELVHDNEQLLVKVRRGDKSPEYFLEETCKLLYPSGLQLTPQVN